jgi:hypothetical protein
MPTLMVLPVSHLKLFVGQVGVGQLLQHVRATAGPASTSTPILRGDLVQGDEPSVRQPASVR